MSALRLSERQLRRLVKDRAEGKRVRIPVERPGRQTEDLFAFQLDAVGVKYAREFRFLADRKYRFDFAIVPVTRKIAVEIDGQVHSIKHQYASDRDKMNLALLTGWRVLHLGPGQVRTGSGVVLLLELLARA